MIFLFTEGGPCVGWRPGPGQPYSWITYQQVILCNIYVFKLVFMLITKHISAEEAVSVAF